MVYFFLINQIFEFFSCFFSISGSYTGKSVREKSKVRAENDKHSVSKVTKFLSECHSA